MKPVDRQKWICDQLRDNAWWHRRVDILNRDFVDAYVAHTRARVIPKMIGADGCPTLASDLLYLYRVGRLTRRSVGIDGLSGMGFPKWVWSYELYVPSP